MSVFSRNSTKVGTSLVLRRSRLFAASRPAQTTASSLPSPQNPRRSPRALIMLLLVCFLLLSGAITYGAIEEASELPLFQPHARIRLTPDIRTVQQAITVLATSSAKPSIAQIHLFIGKSSNKQASTQASGIQQARSAHGTLSFYNQSSSWQTVPAGTTYPGRDGVVISIDTTAHVPPWTLDGGMGSITVQAHTMQPGVTGNIAVNDVTACCGSDGLLVKNANAFSGGQDAATIVTAQDIEKAKASLLPSQQQAAMQDLQKQMSSDDRQLKTSICQPSVQPDHPAGSIASSVNVIVRVTCQEPTVSLKEINRLAGDAFTASQTVRQLGAVYRLQGPLAINIGQAQVTNTSQDPFSITIPVHGTFVYQLDTRTIQQQLNTTLQGASTEKAHALLVHLPGVGSVDIQVSGGWNANTLPVDGTHIDIVEVQPTISHVM